jgi:hypothetical protein
MVDSLELVCGSGYSHEKVAQTISAGWAADPVHPNKHLYAKAALNLMEKMANSKPAATNTGTAQNRKRTWSASNDGRSSGANTNARSGGSGGGGGGAGGSASFAGYSGHSGNYGGGGKKSFRSQQWQEMRRWRDSSPQRDGRDSGHGGGGGSRRDGYGPPQYPREYGGGNYHGNYRGNYRGNGGFDRRFY